MLTEINANNFSAYDNHEKVWKFFDSASGLQGFIAIHNTKLGPATGGTRLWNYSNESAAISDVLNLSQAMSYKCALAGVKFGGGKAVIMASPSRKTSDFFATYGRVINELQGWFTTGTDVGITDGDTRLMAKSSKYILGQPKAGFLKYSTSKMAALGVYLCLRSVYCWLFGKTDLQGARVAVKGVGKLGGELVALLIADGAEVMISDTVQSKVDKLKALYPQLEVIDTEFIHKQPVDIYCPCALGGEFSEPRAGEVKAKIIAGGANNQLVNSRVGGIFYQRDIYYLPDYIINAGGLINIVDELDEDGYQAERVMNRVKGITKTLFTVIERSADEQQPPDKIADALAKEIISKDKL